MKTTIHTLKREYKDNQTYLNEKQNLFRNLHSIPRIGSVTDEKQMKLKFNLYDD